MYLPIAASVCVCVCVCVCLCCGERWHESSDGISEERDISVHEAFDAHKNSHRESGKHAGAATAGVCVCVSRMQGGRGQLRAFQPRVTRKHGDWRRKRDQVS